MLVTAGAARRQVLVVSIEDNQYQRSPAACPPSFNEPRLRLLDGAFLKLRDLNEDAFSGFCSKVSRLMTFQVTKDCT